MRRNKTFSVVFAAIVASAYALLTLALAPISYGPVQLRLSELLCILPFLLPETAYGLFIGCLLANLLTGNVFDVVFGSLATLLAALCTAQFGKLGNSARNRLFACLMPVVFNAVMIGAVITWAYNGMNIFRHVGAFALNAGQIALGEGAVMLLGGLPLLRRLPETKIFRELKNKMQVNDD